MADKEYIERGAFIEDIKTEIMNLYLDGMKGTPRPYKELYDIIDRINEQPTADVAEVRRGEWEIKTDQYSCEYMMCSECKSEFYSVDTDTVDTTPNFCPNCGADMRGNNDQKL